MTAVFSMLRNLRNTDAANATAEVRKILTKADATEADARRLDDLAKALGLNLTTLEQVAAEAFHRRAAVNEIEKRQRQMVEVDRDLPAATARFEAAKLEFDTAKADFDRLSRINEIATAAISTSKSRIASLDARLEMALKGERLEPLAF